MARSRQWYEDVLDVALRATLKEAGFKRKSHATYICERRADRVWVFEIESLRGGPAFEERSGVFVPDLENIVARLAPDMGAYATFMRNPAHFTATIPELVEIERGWDRPTWAKNPKSRGGFLGYRDPPLAEKAIRTYCGGFGWHPEYVDGALHGSGDPWKISRKRAGRGYGYRSLAKKKTILPLGRELDTLWRKYSHDWLQRCDDPHYLAEWFDKHIYLDESSPKYGASAITAIVAFHLAGDNRRAAEIIHGLIAEAEIPFETELAVAEEELRVRLPPPAIEWVLRKLLGPPPPPLKRDPVRMAQAVVMYRRKAAEAGRKLADGLGIKL